MKITLHKAVSADAVPVFVVREGESLKKHVFFGFFSEEDKKYLIGLEKNLLLKGGATRRVFLPSGREALLIGVATQQKFTHRKTILAARQIVAVARKERIHNVAVALDDFSAKDFTGTRKELAEVMATQFEIANFEFVQYKTPPPEGWFFVEQMRVVVGSRAQGAGEGIAAGKIIGEEINHARTLSNTPGGDMTPEKLAHAAFYEGKKYGFKVQVLEETEIKKLGMGGVLGVSRGSAERPKFIVMEYCGSKKNEKPVVLVGKGVTFDTGGLNVKPGDSMYEMHMDMSGGAAVIHTLAAVARLKVKKNITGLVPAVENMPSGSSYRPGDLLKTMSGKTIEVLNTDAEGRVILADALTYAQKYTPRVVIDVATLTGAAMVALGQRTSALFTTTPQLEKLLREAGERTGDFVWPLPLWEEYEEEVRGTFGDVANIGKSRDGGAINGAMFLWQFIKEYPWAHIDIAPRMTTIEGEFLAKGSAGASVALLTHFLRKF